MQALLWQAHRLDAREVRVPCTFNEYTPREDVANLDHVFAMVDGDIYRCTTGRNRCFLIAWQDIPGESTINRALRHLCPDWPVTVNLLIIKLDKGGRPVDIRNRRAIQQATRATAK